MKELLKDLTNASCVTLELNLQRDREAGEYALGGCTC